jgi:predicted ATPase
MVNIGGVNGGLNFQAPVGFLVGDLNNSKTTTAQDIAVAKSLAGQSANSSNFWFDTNLTGFVTAGDIATAKARQGKTIP